MSGASLVADLSGLGRVQAALRRAGDRLADCTPLMRDVGASLVQSTRERFDSQSGPDGKRWRPLSADTVIGRLGGVGRTYTKKMQFRAKARRGMASMRILFRQGHLRNSITARAGADRVEVGTNLVYGAIHQFGGPAGRGRKITIPARPYLGLSDADADRVEGLVQDYLREVLR